MKGKIFLIRLVMIGSIIINVYAEGPVADVFELMEKVGEIKKDVLWPGFYPGEIPTAVYDGVNTYLFKHPSPPEGFVPLRDRQDVFIFSDQNEKVRGNSRVQINGVWTATSVLRTHSRLTGEKYSLQNLTGIIIHEQFHVFQRMKHPDWRPNDGYLFNYPLDTPNMLALRRMETEAFRRAVNAQNNKEASIWVREALMWRGRRYYLLESDLVNYEGELQRFEGLAEYIECKSGDKEIGRIPVDPGFAPAAIRHLGYLLGQWSAAILDRLEPNWKELLESGQAANLHEILKKNTSSSDQKCMFSSKEIDSFFQKAKDDVEKRKYAVQKMRKDFISQPGFRIEVVSLNPPLQLLMFFADRTEAFSENELLHESLVMLRNEKGSITVRDLMSITLNNGFNGVVKFTIAGVEEIPLIEKKEGKIKVTTKGVQAEFEDVEIVKSKNVIKIIL